MGNLRKNFLKINELCKNSGSGLFSTLVKSAGYKIFYNKNIIAHKRVVIKGVKNIKNNNTLTIGLSTAKFVHNKDVTFLNVRGTLQIDGNYNIGRGCRIDIAEGATVTIGENGHMNVNSTFIISNKLVIGRGCEISWNCQFLDDDFHQINYDGKIEKSNSIILGNNIWVGCRVQFYKGAVVPDGCVIAAGSVLRSAIDEPKTLIAGNPAKIIKRNVTWQL